MLLPIVKGGVGDLVSSRLCAFLVFPRPSSDETNYDSDKKPFEKHGV